MPIWGTKFKIALGAIIFIALLGYHHVSRYIAVQEATSALHSEYQEAMREEVLKAQKTSLELVNKLQEDNRKKDEKIKDISSKHSALLSSLSDRTSRDQRNSSTPGSASTCTGAELYREDGEFLAGEAARAERVLTERDFYYEQYERARKSFSPK